MQYFFPLFFQYSLEIDPVCRFDFITVYDGPDTNAPILDILCGRKVAELETTSNSVTLLFSADYANSYFGFSATYSAIPQSNGGKYRDSICKLLKMCKI